MLTMNPMQSHWCQTGGTWADHPALRQVHNFLTRPMASYTAQLSKPRTSVGLDLLEALWPHSSRVIFFPARMLLLQCFLFCNGSSGGQLYNAHWKPSFSSLTQWLACMKMQEPTSLVRKMQGLLYANSRKCRIFWKMRSTFALRS